MDLQNARENWGREQFLCFTWDGFIVITLELNACGGGEGLMLPMKIILLMQEVWQ